jgi:hypothetical protein
MEKMCIASAWRALHRHGVRSYNLLELAIQRATKQREFSSDRGITCGGRLRVGLHHARIGECGKQLWDLEGGAKVLCGE